MVLTLEQATAALDTLSKQLDRRLDDVEKLNEAYDGKHKLQFASDAFDEYFGKQYAKFSDNWTAVVADAPHERLEVTGFRLKGAEKGDDKLWSRWIENEADSYSDMAFLDAIIAKRSFALVWGDPAVITWEHPSQAIVGYDPETRQRKAAAKFWRDGNKIHATLYTPTEVWKFKRNAVSEEGETDSGLLLIGMDGGWTAREVDGEEWPLTNPMGVVPMVEFQNRPRLLHSPISDISGTMAMQHAINLLWAQLFTAADAASFPQRIITGAEIPTVPVLDSDGQETGAERQIDLKKWSMKRAQWIEDPGAKIAEWSAADLENWTKVIDKAVGHISAQSRTPATYFMANASISNISGDTMKALETGLVQRTYEKTEHFGRSVREVFRLVAIAESAGKSKLAAIAAGKTLWKDVETRSDAQRADALSKKRDIGYPLEYILELDGLPPTEVERVLKMVKDESEDPYLARLDAKDAAGADAGAAADG